MSIKLTKYNLNHFILYFILISLFATFTDAQVEKVNIGKPNSNSHPKSAQSQLEKKSEARIVDYENLIHFGDLVDVDVVGSTEYDWRGTITNEGFLNGIEFTEDEIYALCNNVDQVSKKIADSYKKFLNKPKVKVTILDRSNRPMTTLFGAINLPQKFKLKREVRLNELIILSGGFTEKASGEIEILRQTDASCRAKSELDIKRQDAQEKNNFVKVRREPGSDIIKVKISDLLSGTQGANMQVLYGDIVTVKVAEPIYVIGGVSNPTKLPLREKITVTRAIASAGGLTENANKSSIIVFRRENGETKIINVDLKEIETNQALDVELKAYDIVDVTEKKQNTRKYPPIISFDDKKLNLTKLPIRIIN